MWNTWSRKTKATAFGTKKTNSISTKRWKNSSTNICIPRPQLLRARVVQDRANHSSYQSHRSLRMRHALEAPTPDHPERSCRIPLRKLKGVWRDHSTCARERG